VSYHAPPGAFTGISRGYGCLFIDDLALNSLLHWGTAPSQADAGFPSNAVKPRDQLPGTTADQKITRPKNLLTEIIGDLY